MPKFELGQIVATPAAIELLSQEGDAIARADTIALLHRHVSGDWDELDAHDRRMNDDAVTFGYRILSAYTVNGKRLYIITEADRSATTIMLASEY